MIEILWHGRGGQGAFTAARLLGAAASMETGAYALAFPSFGPERRGAPVRAFTKIANEPIGDRSAIEHADFVVYLDDTLLGDSWAAELKPGGRVLVNSVRTFDDRRIIAIDANGLSEEVLGRPIPNTVFLGMLSALCESVWENDVIEAIRQYMPPKLHEKNERIVAAAHSRMLDQLAEEGAFAADAPAGAAPAAVLGSASDGSSASANSAAADEGASDVAPETSNPASASTSAEFLTVAPTSCPDRWRERTPRLRSDFLIAPTSDPAVFAKRPSYLGGHLVSKNAGWRNERPVLDLDACTGCLQCYLYCPDGAIYRRGDAAEPLAIDYDFCKGCGICAKACRFGAIGMIPESEAITR